MAKGNVRKPVLAVKVEGTTSSARKRELGLMDELEKLKKRIREMEVPFEEKKTFHSEYSRSQRDKIKCFSFSKTGHILKMF